MFNEHLISETMFLCESENSVRGLITIVDAWLKGDYDCEDLYPCWCSVVYVVADRMGGKNPAAARTIAQNWKGVINEEGAINEEDHTLIAFSLSPSFLFPCSL